MPVRIERKRSTALFPAAGIRREAIAVIADRHLDHPIVDDGYLRGLGPIRRHHAAPVGRDLQPPIALVGATDDEDRIVGSAHLVDRSEEHTSELQSLMRNSYAVFCLKKKKREHEHTR